MFDLTKALELIGAQTVLHLKERVKTGSFATGSLHGSFRHEVQSHELVTTLTVFAADHWLYVDGGRRSGRMPPKDAILAWMRTKGIEESALWPIRKKIATDGIKAKDYLRDWINAKEQSWSQQIGDTAIQDMTLRFSERFRDAIPKAA